VFVEPCEIVDDVPAREDDNVDVGIVDEADRVTVLLLDVIALLLADDVPLKLPVVVVVTELLEKVEVGEAVVVPLELPVVVVMTELLEVLEVGEAVVVPLVVNTDEDEETEVDEVLLYGAPLEMVLDEIPLEGPVL
jgi:hypothetical protein